MERRTWWAAACVLLVVVASVAPSTSAPPPAREETCTSTPAGVAVLLGDREMTPVCDDVVAEPGATAEDLDRLRRDWQSARGELGRVFGGEVRSSPIVVFCRTAACKLAFGADARAAAAKDLGFASATVTTREGPSPRSAVVVTGPVARTSRILLHEMVHAEAKAYLPYDALPTWFQEGLATHVAGEPICAEVVAPSDLDVSTLATKRAWQRAVAEHGALPAYCAASAAVGRWLAPADSAAERAARIRELLASVAAGSSFGAAFVRGTETPRF